jgi:hypothetical protein
VRAFINGTVDSAPLETGPVALGPEFVIEQAKRNVVHGKGGRSRHKAERSKVRQLLKADDY